MSEIRTEECYIASIDLLGAKELISADVDDKRLNQIKNIYKSWERIGKDTYFSPLQVKFFSDNVVITIRTYDTNGITKSAVDILLEFTAYMADHLLRCDYKPRGGICKGKLYMDDIFVWGKGLVDAYVMESKQAVYPRIIVSPEVLSEASEHLKNFMIEEDTDGKFILNYLKSFGRNKDLWVNDISKEYESVSAEIEELKEKMQEEAECTAAPSDDVPKTEKEKNLEKLQCDMLPFG